MLTKGKRRWLLIYTLIFAVMIVCVFGVFVIRGKSFLCYGDSWTQHYTALVYYAKWLRCILKNLIFERTLDIPTFSASIGYGSDVISTLHYYVIGDPLAFFCFLVPTKYIYIYYSALIFIRLYLAGLSFGLYCFYRYKNEASQLSDTAVLAGSFLYAFCGFAMVFCFTEPYFTNPMIYFPLILVGAEKILDGKRPWHFILSVFIASISNFYFFYMIAALTALYVLWRIAARFLGLRGGRRRLALFALGKITGGAMLGVCMSAVILVPVLSLFVSDARSESNYSYGLLYSLTDYKRNISAFLTVTTNHNETAFGFAAVGLIAVFLLFIQKKHRDLKIAFLFLTAMTLIPMAGRIMNGFSYVCNRWTWGYAFLVAWIVVVKWRDLFETTAREKLALALCMAAYALICIFWSGSKTESIYFALTMMLATAIAASAVYRCAGAEWAYRAVLMCVLVNIAGNGLYYYCMGGSTYIDQFIDADRTMTKLENTESIAVQSADMESGDFYRYTGSLTNKNSTLYSGLHNTQYFWSLANGCITDFQSDMCLSDEIRTSAYTTLDSRTILSVLANVKYYVQTKNVPYGYSYVNYYEISGDWNSIYTVWENDYYLPFGYTYDSYISGNDYEKMTPLEKQEAMLQGCVIDASEAEGAEADVAFTGVSLPYEASADEGLSIEDGRIVVTAANAQLTLTFEGLENSETYLYFTGLNYVGSATKLNINMTATDATDTECSTSLEIFTPQYNWYSNREDFMVNLFYNEDACVSVTLTFPTTGEYTFDSLEVLCQPMDNYADQVAALAEDVMENVDFHENDSFSTNEITGSICLDSDKYLLMTIPYSDGWTAYVDGEEQELLQANTMYMALYLEAGDHEIRLVYHTPGLAAGAAVSAASALLLAGMMIADRKRRTSASV